jgi:hypothetical protein
MQALAVVALALLGLSALFSIVWCSNDCARYVCPARTAAP